MNNIDTVIDKIEERNDKLFENYSQDDRDFIEYLVEGREIDAYLIDFVIDNLMKRHSMAAMSKR